MQLPTLILVRGLPGSGKSYIATALGIVLSDQVGNDNVVMLDPDAIDYASQAYADHVQIATTEGVDRKLHAYRFLRAQAYAGIASSKVIVWNQPFTNLDIFNKMVANMLAQAAEHDVHLRVMVVEINIDSGVAKARVTARKHHGGHGPSDATFGRFASDYVSFASIGYEVVSVDGTAIITDTVAKIMQALTIDA